MGAYKDLFQLAAKVGALEGYSHERTEFSMPHMPGWIGNIERMFNELPRDVKDDCAPEYVQVLESAEGALRKALGHDHPLVAKVTAMIGAVKAAE